MNDKPELCFVFLLQFSFELFDCGQAAALQALRQNCCDPIFGNADRLSEVAQGVLGDDLVLGLAEDDPDARLVVGMAEKIVDRRQVEVHFATELRLEVGDFYLNDEEGAQPEVIEEKIQAELLAANFKRILAADKCEAHAELQQKIPDVLDQSAL